MMATTTTQQQEDKDARQQLHAIEDRIRHRVAAIQEEVTTVGPTLTKKVLSQPLVKIGGALVVGLAVGLLFGGRKKKPRKDFGAKHSHRALVDHYVEAILAEARHRVASGQDMEAAVQAALEDRVPLIVYEVPEASQDDGLVKQVVSLVLRQAVPLGLRMGVDYFTSVLVGEDSST